MTIYVHLLTFILQGPDTLFLILILIRIQIRIVEMMGTMLMAFNLLHSQILHGAQDLPASPGAQVAADSLQ